MALVTAPATIVACLTGVEARLKERVTEPRGLTIRQFPGKPEDFKIDSAVGALLVGYYGSDFGDPRGPGLIAQPRGLYPEVHVCRRGLNSSEGLAGVLGLVDVVVEALLGHVIPATDPPTAAGAFAPLEGVLDRSRGYRDNVWYHTVRFATDTMAVERADELAAPLLQRITAYDDQNETVEATSG